MPVQARHRFSVREYYGMAQSGVHPDARVELFDRQIVDILPLEPFHGGVNRLNKHFSILAKGRWLVAVQNPVRS
jgi:hypothetical protein